MLVLLWPQINSIRSSSRLCRLSSAACPLVRCSSFVWCARASSIEGGGWIKRGPQRSSEWDFEVFLFWTAVKHPLFSATLSSHNRFRSSVRAERSVQSVLCHLFYPAKITGKSVSSENSTDTSQNSIMVIRRRWQSSSRSHHHRVCGGQL